MRRGGGLNVVPRPALHRRLIGTREIVILRCRGADAVHCAAVRRRRLLLRGAADVRRRRPPLLATMHRRGGAGRFYAVDAAEHAVMGSPIALRDNFGLELRQANDLSLLTSPDPDAHPRHSVHPAAAPMQIRARIAYSIRLSDLYLSPLTRLFPTLLATSNSAFPPLQRCSLSRARASPLPILPSPTLLPHRYRCSLPLPLPVLYPYIFPIFSLTSLPYNISPTPSPYSILRVHWRSTSLSLIAGCLARRRRSQARPDRRP